MDSWERGIKKMLVEDGVLAKEEDGFKVRKEFEERVDENLMSLKEQHGTDTTILEAILLTLTKSFDRETIEQRELYAKMEQLLPMMEDKIKEEEGKRAEKVAEDIDRNVTNNYIW